MKIPAHAKMMLDYSQFATGDYAERPAFKSNEDIFGDNYSNFKMFILRNGSYVYPSDPFMKQTATVSGQEHTIGISIKADIGNMFYIGINTYLSNGSIQTLTNNSIVLGDTSNDKIGIENVSDIDIDIDLEGQLVPKYPDNFSDVVSPKDIMINSDLNVGIELTGSNFQLIITTDRKIKGLNLPTANISGDLLASDEFHEFQFNTIDIFVDDSDNYEIFFDYVKHVYQDDFDNDAIKSHLILNKNQKIDSNNGPFSFMNIGTTSLIFNLNQGYIYLTEKTNIDADHTEGGYGNCFTIDLLGSRINDISERLSSVESEYTKLTSGVAQRFVSR